MRYLLVLLFILLAAGSVAFADYSDPSKLPPTEYRLPFTGIPSTGNQLLDLINLIANWVFAIFLAISIIFIVLSAFEFVTAQGDPAKVSKARQSLIYAAIGIAIALLAFGIPRVIRTIVTAGGTQSQESTSPDVLFTPCLGLDDETECQSIGGTCRGGDCVRLR